MRPSRPDLSQKSNEELERIRVSTEFTRAVRSDARSLLLSRGIEAPEIAISPRWRRDARGRVSGDTRKPVLYLRSFEADEFTTSQGSPKNGRVRAEAAFLQPIAQLGPVLAIGRPGEKRPPIGGAFRLYSLADFVDDYETGGEPSPEQREQNPEWHELFHELLDDAGYVVLYAGASHGFCWEVERVFRHEPFVPVILLLSFFENRRPAKRHEAIENFREAFRLASGIGLADLERTRAFYFPRPSEAIPFGIGPWNILAYLNSHLPALTELLDYIDPALSLPYRRVSRQLRISMILIVLAYAAWIGYQIFTSQR